MRGQKKREKRQRFRLVKDPKRLDFSCESLLLQFLYDINCVAPLSNSVSVSLFFAFHVNYFPFHGYVSRRYCHRFNNTSLYITTLQRIHSLYQIYTCSTLLLHMFSIATGYVLEWVLCDETYWSTSFSQLCYMIGRQKKPWID